MIITSEYLNDKIFFNSFDEVKEYYEKPEAYDVDDLNEVLKEEYAGDAYPKIKVIDNYEVECWWKGKNFNDYYDTIEEAKEVFEKILEEMEEIKEDFKETTDKEKFIKELEENDELVDYIQINKFDEFENVEVLIGKEISFWKGKD